MSYTSSEIIKQLGENGHVEYGWSNNLSELFCQVYFQLVRAKSQKETLVLRNKINYLLKNLSADIQAAKEKKTLTRSNELLMMLYKLIGHTRDIEKKGERQLAYAQLWEWYNFYPDLTLFCVKTFVYYVENGEINTSKHQYGSWNDIKYMCEAFRELNGGEHHPLISYAIRLMCTQLKEDLLNYKEEKPVSLAAKHCPREKGRFDWLFRRIAHEMFPYTKTARTALSHTKGEKKAFTHLRKEYIVPLSKYLDVVQIKMSSGRKGEGDWDKIDFNKVTSKSLRMYSRAWSNVNKHGLPRTSEEHRVTCSKRYKGHIEAALEKKEGVKVHGKRCNTYELVKDVFTNQASYGNPSERVATEKGRINLQWESNSKETKNLGSMISIVDTSGSMSADNNTPLYNAIGLGIRICEKTISEFKNRLLTFNSTPRWVKLNEDYTFYDKVLQVASINDWGMSTNLQLAMKVILDAIVESEIPPVKVEQMVLVVLSDMQMNQGSNWDDTMSDEIKKMYKEAGEQSKYKKAYNPPHILWWNLRQTNGFPAVSSENNTTMVSGYNAGLLTEFENKGIGAFTNYTPYKMITQILDNSRYNMLQEKYFELI
jgi:hypothetical protein